MLHQQYTTTGYLFCRLASRSQYVSVRVMYKVPQKTTHTSNLKEQMFSMNSFYMLKYVKTYSCKMLHSYRMWLSISKSRLDVHEVGAVLLVDSIINKEWNLFGDYFGLRCKSPLTNSSHYGSSGRIPFTPADGFCLPQWPWELLYYCTIEKWVSFEQNSDLSHTNDWWWNQLAKSLLSYVATTGMKSGNISWTFFLKICFLCSFSCSRCSTDGNCCHLFK